MAATKPKTGDGPLEAARERHEIVMCIPSEDGGRLIIGLALNEVSGLASALSAAV